MELRHLRYFVAVAEELSFTRAAERLHIGQPPLSHQIQALEAEVGAQLLERSKRWVRLTEAGKHFLEDARRVLELSQQAMQTARRVQRGEAGELRVGYTYSTPLTPLFANTINRYRERYPGVTLILEEVSTQRQLDALAARELDLGLIRPPEGGLPDTLQADVLREDRLILALPANHPLTAHKSITIADLEGLPFVMFPKDAGTGIYTQIIRLCRAAGFQPTIAMEAKEASTMIGLVAARCGIAIMPPSFGIIAMEGVKYCELADPAVRTALMLARRKDDRSALVAAFVEVALEAAATSSPRRRGSHFRSDSAKLDSRLLGNDVRTAGDAQE